MLIASGTLRRLARSGAVTPPARLDRWLVVLCAITLVVGLAQVFVSPLLGSEDLKGRLENILEWYTALAFTLFFLALAWIWRKARLAVHLN
jgi:protein-S-isoprenylcysteine O-methyltransferase Ste14